MAMKKRRSVRSRVRRTWHFYGELDRQARGSYFTAPCFERLEDRMLLTVRIIDDFAGNGGGAPPDVAGAAGPNSYIESSNSTLTIYNKATGAPLVPDGGPVNVDTFFFTTGGLTQIDPDDPSDPNDPVSQRIADVTMVYDDQMGRFIIGNIDVSRIGIDGSVTTNKSQFVFAVSTDNNPTDFTTGHWKFYQVTTTEGSGAASSWSDYPGNPGFNNDAFVVTFNMFGNGPTGTQVVSIDASDLAAGNALVLSGTGQNVFRNDVPGGARDYRPTTMHDSVAGDPMWLIRNPGDGTHIEVVEMTNVLKTSAAFNTTSLDLVPWGKTFVGSGITDPLNPDSSLMDDVGSRILKAAEYNDTIVATHTVAVGTASVISASVQGSTGGSGYKVNDRLFVTGGEYTARATLRVTKVGPGGSVTAVTVANAGNYSKLGGTITGAVEGGGGSGAMFNIFFSGELDVQWYAIDVSGATPDFEDVGRIGFGPNTYAFEPAIDINARGEIGLGFMQSDTLGGAANVTTGGFPSTFVTARQPTDAAGTMQPVVLVPAGRGRSNIGSGSTRIGDFSGMNVDPENGSFWHVNQFGQSGNGPTAIANFTSVPAQLVISGDGRDDILTLNSSSSGTQVTLNGVAAFYPPRIYTSILITLGGGSNVINLEGTAANVPVFISGGGTDPLKPDIVNIGTGFFLSNVRGIQGEVWIESTFTTIDIDDSGDSTAQNFILGTNPFDKDLGYVHATMLPNFSINYKYANTKRLNLRTGAVNGNVVNVLESGKLVPIDVLNYGFAATVNIGDDHGVQRILGEVTIQNRNYAAGTTINIDDLLGGKAQKNAHMGTIAPEYFGPGWGYISLLAPADINYKYASTSNLTIHTSAVKDNVFSVLESGVKTNIVNHARATVNVGDVDFGVQDIFGELNITNVPRDASTSPGTIINIDDIKGRSAKIEAHMGTIPPQFLGPGWGYINKLAPADIHYKYADTRSLTIDTSEVAGNVFGVWESGVPTNIVNHARATVNVGDRDVGVQSMVSLLTITNAFPTHGTTINIDDKADASARRALLATIGQPGWGYIEGLAPPNAGIRYRYSDTFSLTIDAGSGGNTFTVLNTSPGATTTLNTGSGNDTVDVGNDTVFVQGTSPNGTLVVNGGIGADTFFMRGSLGPVPVGINGGNDNDTVYVYGSTGAVSINGDADNDTIRLLRNSGPVNVTGGTGTNTVTAGDATQNLDGILGAVEVDGANGSTSLILDDRANRNQRLFPGTFQATDVRTIPAYQVTLGSVTRTNDRTRTSVITRRVTRDTPTETFNYSNLASLEIDGGGSGNAYSVLSTAALTPLTINAGDARDSLNTGNDTVNLQGSAAPVNVFGGSGNDAVTLLSTAAPVNVFGEGGNDTVTLQGTAAPVNVFGGSGNDSVNLLGTAAQVNVFGDSDTNTVTAGDASHNLDGIRGAVAVDGANGSTSLILDDRANRSDSFFMTHPSYLVTQSSVTRSNSFIVATIGYRNIAGLNLYGGSSGNTFDVQNTAAGTPLTINAGDALDSLNPGNDTVNLQGTAAPVYVLGGTGDDTVNVGSPGNLLDALHGQVSVNGQGGTDVLNVNDQADRAGTLYNVSFGDITAAGPGVAASLDYDALESLVLNTGDNVDGNTTIVAGTRAGTPVTINPGPHGTIILGNAAGRLDDLRSLVTVNGQGNNNLSASDIAQTVGHAYYVTSDTPASSILSRDGQRLASYSGISSFSLTGGSGNDEYNLESILPATYLAVYAGGGNDTFNLSPTARNLDTLPGTLFLHGAGPGATTGTATLNVNDQSNLWDAAWTLRSTDLVRLGPGPGTDIVYDNFNNLAVNAGPGNDSVKVQSTPAGTAVSLDGGGAINTLDYSPYATSVTVNLATGGATGLSAIANIVNVVGSAYNDNLTGNAGNNVLIGGEGADTLFGGTGRDLLIGGLGLDVLDGGANDDILIGGYTDYDTQIASDGAVSHAVDPAALRAIMLEWTRFLIGLNPFDSYNRRILHLTTGGGGLNGGYVLTSGASGTVKDDATADQLTGGAAYDWFFAQLEQDALTDRNSDPTNQLEVVS